MGGKSSSNSFSICNIFKVCFSGGSSASRDDDSDEGDTVRRLPSNEDRWGRSAEVIDYQATAYIDRIYKTRASKSKHHSRTP